MSGLARALCFTISISLLAACGQAPATAPKREAPVVAPSAPAVAPSPATGAAQAEGQALLAAVRQTFESCKGVEAEVKSWSEGHYKSGKRVSELRRNSYRTKLVWMKPAMLRGDILETDNFLVGGAKMVSRDGKTITIKAGGVLGLFPIKVPAADPLLSSNRNHKFTDMSPDAILQSVLGPQARWTVVGVQAGAKLVQVDGVPALDGEITRQVLAVEPATSKLRSLVMYEGAKKVVDYQFLKFRWNPQVKSDLFQL